MEQSRNSDSTLSVRSQPANDSKRFARKMGSKIKHVISTNKWVSDEQLQKRDRRMALLGVRQIGSRRDFLETSPESAETGDSHSSFETSSTNSSPPQLQTKPKNSLRIELSKSDQSKIAEDTEWKEAFGNIRGAAALLVSTDNIDKLGEHKTRSNSSLSSEDKYSPAVSSKISFRQYEKEGVREGTVVDKKHFAAEQIKSCRSASIQTEEIQAGNVDLPDVVNELNLMADNVLEKSQRTQLLENIANLTEKLETQESKLNYLKQYLDGLLLHIMDTDPSILEVSYTVRKEPVLL